MPIQSLAEQLQRDEGIELFPYTDTTGNLTIGVGRNLTANGIRLSEAQEMLTNDIDAVTSELQTKLPWLNRLDIVRQGALLNMAFNLGVDGLLTFDTFLSYMQKRYYLAAAKDMLNTLWAQQVGDRAYRLSVQIVTGVWQ